MTRGMGNLLRGPNPFRIPIARGQAPNLGPSVLSPVIGPLSNQVLSPLPPPSPQPSHRVLRDRTKHDRSLPEPPPNRPVKRMVKDRWYYEPVTTLLATAPSVISEVCGTGDVYEALAEKRGSLPEHGASRLEHFPLVREIASPGKVSWAWPGVSPGPESRVTPLLLRPQLPTGPFSS
jgi:hypothetical protein